MLDLTKYDSLGAALRDALDRWPDEVCLIEADREREKERLTYKQFEAGRASISCGAAGAWISRRRSRRHHHDQSIEVADFRLRDFSCRRSAGAARLQTFAARTNGAARAFARERARHRISDLAFDDAGRGIREASRCHRTRHRSAGRRGSCGGAIRWEEFRAETEPTFVPRKREDWACIVYSSGTGGRPKGCVLTHENYLEQCVALTKLYAFWPGVRYLSILPTNHAIDFMVGFIGPFVCGATVVHLRTLRPEYVREAFPKYKITYMALVPLVLKNLQKGLQAKI